MPSPTSCRSGYNAKALCPRLKGQFLVHRLGSHPLGRGCQDGIDDLGYAGGRTAL